MDLKELLYLKINQLGTDFIKMQIKDNILNSEYIIKQIVKECAIARDAQNLSNSDYVSLAEGLMHYLLAITITPSQRKIDINNTEVSILVPGAKYLENSEDKVIIIQFIKGNRIEYEKTIRDLLKIQPVLDNIWLVSWGPLVNRYPLRNFVIDDNSIKIAGLVLPFSKILIEINDFLVRINYKGFRIL